MNKYHFISIFTILVNYQIIFQLYFTDYDLQNNDECNCEQQVSFLLPYVVRKAFRTSLSVRCLIGFCGSLYQIKEMKFSLWFCYEGASLVAQRLKNLPAMQDTQVDPWVRKIPWRREWQSSILAWRIPCTEEPGRLQSMGSQRVGHD